MPHLLVVGAGPGIAAATARRFGRDGSAVSLVARRPDALRTLQRELGDEQIAAGWRAADAGDADALTEAIEELVTETGPVDVLLHNVSVGREVVPGELTPQQLAADLATGVVSLQTAVHAVLPGMRALGSGTVLATGSGAADRPLTALASLGVQKAALRSLAQVLAQGLAAEGVHVATVTILGFVGEGEQIEPDRVAALYAQLAAETAGPRDAWRSVVDLTP